MASSEVPLQPVHAFSPARRRARLALTAAAILAAIGLGVSVVGSGGERDPGAVVNANPPTTEPADVDAQFELRVLESTGPTPASEGVGIVEIVADGRRWADISFLLPRGATFGGSMDTGDIRLEYREFDCDPEGCPPTNSTGMVQVGAVEDLKANATPRLECSATFTMADGQRTTAEVHRSSPSEPGSRPSCEVRLTSS